LRAILAEPEFQQDFANRGVLPVVSPLPDELQRFVKSEIVRWGKVVEQAGAAGSQSGNDCRRFWTLAKGAALPI